MGNPEKAAKALRSSIEETAGEIAQELLYGLEERKVTKAEAAVALYELVRARLALSDAVGLD